MSVTRPALPWQTYQVARERSGAGNGHQVLSRRWDFETPVCWDRLRRALDVVASRHPTLSCVFSHDGRTFTDGVRPPVIVYDDPSADLARPPDLDLVQGPVFLMRGSVRRVELWAQHAVCDARSLSLIADELADAYDGVDLPELGADFDDYAEFIRSEADRQWNAPGCQAWLGQLRLMEWPPPVQRRPAVPGAFESVVVPLGEEGAVMSRLRRSRLTPTTLPVHLASKSIGRVVGVERVLVGVTSAIRPLPRFNGLVADMANMLFVATEVGGTMEQHQTAFATALSHYAVYHPRVSAELGCHDAGRVRVDFKPATSATLTLAGQTGRPVPPERSTSRDLGFELQISAGRAQVSIARRVGYEGPALSDLAHEVVRVCNDWMSS